MKWLHNATVRFLDEHALGRPRILAAVSGGADSTALLTVLGELGIDVVAGHVNHHLRGEESNEDERFLRELCAARGVELVVADGTLPPELVRRHGIEGAARAVRYERLHELRIRSGAAFIATAHQQNDQAETVLMRSMTGTGAAGRRAIHPIRDDGVIRPLLDVPREAIDDFLAERGIAARIDRTNADGRFLRNAIRAALPPEAVAPLAAEATSARAAWIESERRVDVVDDSEATEMATRFRSLPDDRELRRALLVRHIRRLDPNARDLTAAGIARIADAADDISRMSITKHLELVRRAGVVILRRLPAPTAPFEAPLAPGRPAYIAAISATVHVRAVADDAVGSAVGTVVGTRERQRIQLPAGSEPAFTVRNRRRGDRFQPLGLGCDKKLKDFFIDRKIAVETRDQIPLILWNGAVVSVAGVEVSERFKITSAAGERYEVWVEHEHQEDLRR